MDRKSQSVFLAENPADVEIEVPYATEDQTNSRILRSLFFIHTAFMWILFAAAALSFALSLVAKLAADALLTERIPLVGSFIGLRFVENAGVAFSIRFPGQLQALLIGAAFLLILWASLHAKTAWSRVAFGAIVGGALGNIVDRFRDGLVTDFFQVGTFPVFNVADSFVTVGAFLLLAEAVWKRWRSR